MPLSMKISHYGMLLYRSHNEIVCHSTSIPQIFTEWLPAAELGKFLKQETVNYFSFLFHIDSIKTNQVLRLKA